MKSAFFSFVCLSSIAFAQVSTVPPGSSIGIGGFSNSMNSSSNSWRTSSTRIDKVNGTAAYYDMNGKIIVAEPAETIRTTRENGNIGGKPGSNSTKADTQSNSGNIVGASASIFIGTLFGSFFL